MSTLTKPKPEAAWQLIAAFRGILAADRAKVAAALRRELDERGEINGHVLNHVTLSRFHRDYGMDTTVDELYGAVTPYLEERDVFMDALVEEYDRQAQPDFEMVELAEIEGELDFAHHWHITAVLALFLSLWALWRTRGR
jgi:hypothetical protein